MKKINEKDIICYSLQVAYYKLPEHEDFGFSIYEEACQNIEKFDTKISKMDISVKKVIEIAQRRINKLRKIEYLNKYVERDYLQELILVLKKQELLGFDKVF